MTDNRQPAYSVRLPLDLRKELEQISKNNGRSLHAEIILRLRHTVDKGIGTDDLALDERIRNIALKIVKEELANK